MIKHGNSKYRPKFAKDLRNGLRKDGKSIEEVCSLWKVTTRAYYGWIEAHETFAEAHAIGEQDKTAWWRQLQRSVASGAQPGNAGVINLALKNEANYVDKQEVHNTHEEKLTTIKIEMLPPRAQQEIRVINGEVSNSKLDSIPS